MADKRMNQFTTATDGAYIYAEAADGSQVKINKKDLAKIIGGITTREIPNKDLNECVLTGFYTQLGSGYENSPTTDAAVLIVYSNSVYAIQYLYELNLGSVYYRRILIYNSNFGTWRKIH